MFVFFVVVFFVLSLFKLPCLFVCLCVRADYVSGGEMFTHLYQRDHFPEEAVRIYIGEIILALEHLHKVGVTSFIFRLLLQLGSDLHFSMKFFMAASRCQIPHINLTKSRIV